MFRGTENKELILETVAIWLQLAKKEIKIKNKKYAYIKKVLNKFC